MSDKPIKTEEREGSDNPDLLYLLQGAEYFSHFVFPDREALFKSLAHQQAPHTLFITCAEFARVAGDDYADASRRASYVATSAISCRRTAKCWAACRPWWNSRCSRSMFGRS